MTTIAERPEITLLDGGMGRELLRTGAPFQQPQWPALALIQKPELVKKAHQSFAAAGSDVLTTNNYAVVPFHIGEEQFYAKGGRLTALSGRLAREAAAPYGSRVAGSIPPLFGSYRPDLFIPEQAPALLEIIIEALSAHIDIWLAETISCIDEALAVAKALSGDNRPFWASFTLLDGPEAQVETPRIRSNELVVDAVDAAIASGASAVLFNCSQPEVMSSAIDTAARVTGSLNKDLQIGVYANAFPPQQSDAAANSNLLEIRSDLNPQGYLGFAESWCRQGATIIGGCCGIGPEHITALHKKLK